MPYFDHNATTPLFPVAREAWLKAADEAWQNPSSPYRSSARVHRLLEEARHRVAGIVGGEATNIVFNSGATEANNAILAWAARNLPTSTTVLISPTEHPSALEPAKAFLADRLEMLSLGAEGAVDVEALEETLARARVGLVMAMAANNETGVINPVDAIAAACRRKGVLLAIDSSQWIGKLPGGDLPQDAFIIGCAHKFGGPKGTGFIRLPVGAEGFAGARGGAQENGHRAGTEDYPGIAAMVTALEYCERFTDADRALREGWRDACAGKLVTAIAGATIVGPPAPRLWNTLSITMPRHENTRWVTRLDRAGFQVSTGSACATASGHPSHVLAAMGLSPEQARRTIRISAGWETTVEDWEALTTAVIDAWQYLEQERSGDTGSNVIEI